VRRRLQALGLEKEAAVFVAQDFDAGREARVRSLWDGKALNAAYRQLRSRLETWMKRAHRLETEVAARESYLLGGGAIREVVYDPLLPEPFVDTAARHDFFETVGRFDRFGKAIWRRLHAGNIRPEAGQRLAAALH
jgi:phenylacetic acid degradation operon negative regulatory protein